MTTVIGKIINGKATIVADTQSSAGSRVSKIANFTRGDEEYLVGFTGLISEGMAFIEYLQGTRRAFKSENLESLVIVTGRDGWQMYVHDVSDITMRHEIFEIMWSIGSGSHYALGALNAGASLDIAMRIASNFDAGTGEEIETISKSYPEKAAQNNPFIINTVVMKGDK